MVQLSKLSHALVWLKTTSSSTKLTFFGIPGIPLCFAREVKHSRAICGWQAVNASSHDFMNKPTNINYPSHANIFVESVNFLQNSHLLILICRRANSNRFKTRQPFLPRTDFRPQQDPSYLTTFQLCPTLLYRGTLYATLTIRPTWSAASSDSGSGSHRCWRLPPWLACTGRRARPAPRRSACSGAPWPPPPPSGTLPPGEERGGVSVPLSQSRPQ